jgi:chemotaxis protein CheD
MPVSRTQTEMSAGPDPLQAALRDNDRLYERLLGAEQQVGQLANLLVALNSLHGAANPAGVFLAVREVVANLVGSEEFALFEVGPGNRTQLLDASGVITDALGDSDAGIVGAVATTGKPFIRRAGGAGVPGSDASITACLPLRIRGSVVGVLAIFRLLPHKAALEDGDLALFDLLSTHVASALLVARPEDEARS